MTYRECFPANFAGPEIELPEITVGDEGFELDVKFDQAPCTYQQEYSVEVVDKKTGQVITTPAFISPDGKIIIIDTPEDENVGEYEVKVCSKIFNSLETTECTSFEIKVVPLPEPEVEIIYTEEPQFMVVLQDQKVRVGDSLSYSPGANVDTYGHQMEVKVFLGAAFKFSTYDPELNLFRVNGSLLSIEDVGVYPIELTAKFTNGTFVETYKKTFLLTIWDDTPPPEEKAWFPEEPIETQNW